MSGESEKLITKSVTFNSEHLKGYQKARDRHFLDESNARRATAKMADHPSATLLKVPTNEFEKAYYEVMSVIRKNSEVYFSLVNPLPKGLETFRADYEGAKRPEFVIFRPRKFKQAFGWRGLRASGVQHIRGCEAYVYPLDQIDKMPEFLWEYVVKGAEAYRPT